MSETFKEYEMEEKPTKPAPITRAELEAMFNLNEKMKVVFTKKDGAKRTMICTRNSNIISPNGNIGEPVGDRGTTSKPPSETSFPVFDLEKNDWRSFTIANVIGVEVIE